MATPKRVRIPGGGIDRAGIGRSSPQTLKNSCNQAREAVSYQEERELSAISRQSEMETLSG
jgi:hypothetical protein